MALEAIPHYDVDAFGYWYNLPDAANSNYDTVKANLRTVVGQAAHHFSNLCQCPHLTIVGLFLFLLLIIADWWKKLFPHTDKMLKTAQKIRLSISGIELRSAALS